MSSRKALKKWEVRVLKTSIKPSYFDPYIFKKVLEDVMLPPIAKEILEPQSMSHRHRFLFHEIKSVLKENLEARQKIIEDMVLLETDFQVERLLEYIGIDEKEKQQWFAQLRADFKLPPEYEFE